MVHGWESVESLPLLGEDEVHIWRIELPDAGTPPEEYFHRLTAEEQARAERMRAGVVRLQFVVARACLRTLLGHTAGLDPTAVAITQTSFGKPETVGMFFNVAHSGAAILIALCRSRSVGIDIEYFSREVDALEIAKNSFSSNEFLALSSISDSDSLRRSFFRCWTRKEAVIKADGRGLSLPLDSFEVPVGDVSRATEVLISESGKQPVGHYFVCDVPYGDDVAAAVAIAAPRGHAHGFFFPLSMVPRKR